MKARALLFMAASITLVILVSGCTQSDSAADLPAPVGEEPTDTGVVPNTLPETGKDIGVTTTPEPEVEPGLVAHYTFDVDAKDSTTVYHAQLVGNPVFEPGKRGNAIYLDGTNDYVSLPDSATQELGTLSQGTIAFWFKFESLLDTQTVMPLLYFGMDEGADNLYVIEIGHSANDGGTDLPDPSDTKIYSTWVKDNREPFLCFDSKKNLNENEWYHYAVVVGPGGNTGYLNGVELGERDYNFGHTDAPSFLAAIKVKEKFTLGYGRSSFMISPDFVYYKGALDDVRIYDRPLTAGEIAGLQ